jgi:hypothetical protein
MVFQSPNLDDRDFYQLIKEARQSIAQSCPQWTDLSPSDPGIVLLELFAYLTEAMIYRLNRLPEKAYVEFLRLIGVKVRPPSAACVSLRFSLSRPQDQPVEIPRGTRVSLGRTSSGAEAPVFVTARTATINAGQTEVETLACHCELVQAELAGIGSGEPGLSVTARRPPIVASNIADLDLIVGVEARADELTDRVRALEYNGRAYRVWQEVDNFANLKENRFVYIVDRMTGVVTFAPAVQMREPNGGSEARLDALAEKPPAGREIRFWYCRGGGPEGNVTANSLVTLKDPIGGVSVTNPRPAAGGRAAETLQNALARGPQELRSLQRAVTARDFELIALGSSGAIARAKAFTKAALWVHAPPGTIEVLLVPSLPEEVRGSGPVTAGQLKEYETEEARASIQQSLDERRPLGTTCLVNWVRYKSVRVSARVVVHRGEDTNAVRARVLSRLYRRISPLPDQSDDSRSEQLSTSGWPFGQPLRASHVYDIVLGELGVSYVDSIRLLVDEVPESQVQSVAADAFQPQTWYAASGSTLFRSMNDGTGWELIQSFDEGEIERVLPHPGQAGVLAVVTRLPDVGSEGQGSRLHVSADCGEHWRVLGQTAFTVNDAAWTMREGIQLLLLATDSGLYELALHEGASPVQVSVDASNQKLGFYAITATTGIRGTYFVAVAARNLGGVFLSSQGGKPDTFANIGLTGEDVRVLAVQQDGVRTFLWAGMAAVGNEAGKGSYRWELRGAEPPREGGVYFQAGWTGGSCHALAFLGSYVMAATHQSGILWLDSSKGEAATWHPPVIGCGLPIRDVERIFQPVWTVGADPDGRLLLAGGPVGVYCSRDSGVSYESCSSKEFAQQVTLPETWLFCSGEHEILVVSEDEAARD